MSREEMNQTIMPPATPSLDQELIINENIILEQKKPFINGQFLYINDERTRTMLVNCWNAVTETELWDYMKNECPTYAFSDAPEVNRIHNKMEELGYTGHSGCSFGWTMRQLQYIAQHGEEQYINIIRQNY